MRRLIVPLRCASRLVSEFDARAALQGCRRVVAALRLRDSAVATDRLEKSDPLATWPSPG